MIKQFYFTLYVILTVTTILVEGEPGSNDNEVVFHILQSSRTESSKSDAV